MTTAEITMKDLTFEELLTLDAHSIQKRLKAGNLTSAQLVRSCSEQIVKHNTRGAKLRAVLSITPWDKLLKWTQDLDSERAEGKARSVFHGIPILLKVSCSLRAATTVSHFQDWITTSKESGLQTTVGSVHLSTSSPIPSPIIQKVREQSIKRSDLPRSR